MLLMYVIFGLGIEYRFLGGEQSLPIFIIGIFYNPLNMISFISILTIG